MEIKVKNISPELIEWVEKNINLIEWVKIADSKIENGKIVINYHQGKITSYDICPRLRTDLRDFPSKTLQ